MNVESHQHFLMDEPQKQRRRDTQRRYRERKAHYILSLQERNAILESKATALEFEVTRLSTIIAQSRAATRILLDSTSANEFAIGVHGGRPMRGESDINYDPGFTHGTAALHLDLLPRTVMADPIRHSLDNFDGHALGF